MNKEKAEDMKHQAADSDEVLSWNDQIPRDSTISLYINLLNLLKEDGFMGFTLNLKRFELDFYDQW